MTTEVLSILVAIGGASTARMQSHRTPASLRRLLLVSVITAFCNFILLSSSGILRRGDDALASIHRQTGHLMLPLVAFATGLWSGVSLPRIWRRPLKALPRVFFLLLLCFCCLSNTWTGYFGPSRIDPRENRENYLRFQVLHEGAMPILTGTMLLFWVGWLAARPSETANVE